MYSELVDEVNTSFMSQKLQNFDYANFLYLALCNNEWTKGSIKNTFSWRAAGGFVADLRKKKDEDYMTFYCSLSEEHREGYVHPDIETDLGRLGWTFTHR